MKYPETVLLTAFNKRFIEGKTITAISYEIGVDRKYLSKVMLGHKRKEVKQRWDFEQANAAPMFPAAKCSAIFTFFQALGLPFRKKG